MWQLNDKILIIYCFCVIKAAQMSKISIVNGKMIDRWPELTLSDLSGVFWEGMSCFQEYSESDFNFH